MSLLIDGYNLLHVSGVFPQRAGPGNFERSRNALLNFLASTLDEDERENTVIVFDACDAPPGLPRIVKHRGLTVRYAAGYADADSLIEELIRCDSSPRRLTVVSSDHRVQRAAKRRRAAAVDSDRWFDQLVQRQPRSAAADEPAKPSAPLSAEEVRQWLEEFAIDASEDLTPSAKSDRAPSGESTSAAPASPHSKPGQPECDDLANPFPPGYADDLLEEE